MVKKMINFREGSTRQYQPYTKRVLPAFLVFRFLKIQDFAGGSPQTCWAQHNVAGGCSKGLLLTPEAVNLTGNLVDKVLIVSRHSRSGPFQNPVFECAPLVSAEDEMKPVIVSMVSTPSAVIRRPGRLQRRQIWDFHQKYPKPN